MKIYLVQHGASEPKTIDPDRPLTAQGRHDVQQVTAFAARLGLDVEQIRHSGKTRAKQTAEILGEALSPAGGVVVTPGMAPNDDVRPVAEALARESQPVMLVGHLPFLARLAGLLVTGSPDRSIVRFRNAGIVCLAREEGRWLIVWIITPDMAGT